MFQFILIAILTTINAFFAASEMALVSLNKNRIRIKADKGDKTAALLVDLFDQPSQFLSTIQVGITLAGFFSSAFAATGISDDLAQLLRELNVPYSSQIAIIIITVILSYITLVFGELFPKQVALTNPEKIARFSVRPILIVAKVTIPFVKLLSFSTSILVKLTGLNKEQMDEQVSEDEIKYLIEAGFRHGAVNIGEKEMIHSVFKFNDKVAKEIMVPISRAFLLDIDTPKETLLEQLLLRKFSRIPIYEGNPNRIIGILYLKELLIEAYDEGFKEMDIRSILHEPHFVSEDKQIDDLFKELQMAKNHMAILTNKDKKVTGIVTIEDLVEEVMGEIYDEHDDDKLNIVRVNPNTYIVSGELTMENFNQYLHLSIAYDETKKVNDFIFDQLGYQASIGDVISLDQAILKVEAMKDRKISKVKVSIKK